MELWLVENKLGKYPGTLLTIYEDAVVIFDFERSRIYQGDIKISDNNVITINSEIPTTIRPITMKEIIRDWSNYFLSERPKNEQEAEQLLQQSLDNAYYL